MSETGQLDELQIFGVLSSEEVSTVAEVVEKTADHTEPECAESVRRHSPVLELQVFTVPSAEQVSTVASSAENSADHNGSECPESVNRHSPLLELQIFAVLS